MLIAVPSRGTLKRILCLSNTMKREKNNFRAQIRINDYEISKQQVFKSTQVCAIPCK